MERHTSSNDVAFMERSLPVSAFSPGHNFGIVLHGVDEIPRFQWAIGTANIFVVRYQFNPGYKWPLMHPKRGAYW